MNDLTEKFAGKFTCLGFPTNQFGKQTNEKDWELLPMLAHVRPGGGFVPNFPSPFLLRLEENPQIRKKAMRHPRE